MFTLLSRKPGEILLKKSQDQMSGVENAMERMDIRGDNIDQIGSNKFLEQPNEPKQEETATPAHINQLPESLLIRIFKTAIDEHDSLVVASLLLVCREWHTITKGTPLLWSRILICPKGPKHDYKKLTKYVDTAIRMSLDLPLDVWIDFSEVPSKNMDFGCPNFFAKYCTPVKYDNRLELTLLLRTVGRAGSVMKRWRSFYLSFPDQVVYILQFINSLLYPTPLLEDLSIHLIQLFHDSRDKHLFPQIPALRRYVLDAAGDLGDIKCPPMMLESLCLRIWRDIGVIAPFVNLRTPTIENLLRCGTPHTDAVCEDCRRYHQSREAIRLPLLECLTIQSQKGNRLSVGLIERIKASSLKTLRLLGSLAVFIGMKATSFYRVEALHLLVELRPSAFRDELEPLLRSQGTSIEGVMSSPAIQTKLEKYTALKNLTVAPWHLNVAMRALQNLKSRGDAPKALHTVSILVADRKGEVLKDDAGYEKLVAPWKSVDDFVYRSHIVIS